MTRRRPFATILRAACGLAALSFSSRIEAQAPMVGPRAAGMAGAVTAAVDDATAIWTNPAGLARIDGINADLLASGLASNRNGFTGAIQRLSSLDLKEIVANHDVAAAQQAVSDVQSLVAPGTGAVGSGIAGLVFAKSGFAIAIDDVAYGGAYPTIDLVRVLPVDDPNVGLAFNQTGVSFAGLEAREARFSYAHAFFEKVLLVGGTLRYVNGRTYFFHESIFDLGSTDPVDLVREALKHNAHDTGKLTYDLGAMVNILGVARVGLSSTSINEPEFTVSNNPSDPTLVGAPATIRLPRTFRAGVAAQPVGALTLAVDYDLRATDTLIPGGKSRQLALGAEFKIPLFAFRAGAFRDSEAPDAHWAYSAGFGFGLNMVSVNLAAVLSTEGGASLSTTNRRDVGAGVDVKVKF